MKNTTPYKRQELHTLDKNNILIPIKTDNLNKHREVPKSIFSSSSIKQMRKEWRNDLIQIHNKLDDIENELEKLERLCRQLNNLLGGNDNEDNSFIPVVSAVNNIKRNFTDANDNVTQLKKAVDTFKLEDNSEYKKLKKKNEHHEIINLYTNLHLQTKKVFDHLNNFNFINNDNEKEDDTKLEKSTDDADKKPISETTKSIYRSTIFPN